MYNKFVQIIEEQGGAFSGFSYVGDCLPEALKKYPYAITFGIRLSDAIIDEIESKPTYTYFNHYRSVNALIDQISLKLVLTLENQGNRAYSIAASQSIPDAPVPYSGMFPHKTGAVRAGLGWIGKNGLFIHHQYGPRVRLGTVLTDRELPVAEFVPTDPCFQCDKCVTACPALALTGNPWKPGVLRDQVIDAKACSEYMNRHFKHIGRGSVCGLCIRVCPVRKENVSK